MLFDSYVDVMEASQGHIAIGFNHPLPKYPVDGAEEKQDENKNEPEAGPSTPRKSTSEDPASPPTTPRGVEPSDVASSSSSTPTTTTTTTTTSTLSPPALPTSESQKSFLPSLLPSRSTKNVRDRSATQAKPVSSVLDEHIGENSYLLYSRDSSWISRITIAPEIAGAWTVRKLTMFPESITYPSLAFEPTVSLLFPPFSLSYLLICIGIMEEGNRVRCDHSQRCCFISCRGT
jgi:hypothetical protein